MGDLNKSDISKPKLSNSARSKTNAYKIIVEPQGRIKWEDDRSKMHMHHHIYPMSFI